MAGYIIDVSSLIQADEKLTNFGSITSGPSVRKPLPDISRLFFFYQKSHIHKQDFTRQNPVYVADANFTKMSVSRFGV